MIGNELKPRETVCYAKRAPRCGPGEAHRKAYASGRRNRRSRDNNK